MELSWTKGRGDGEERREWGKSEVELTALGCIDTVWEKEVPRDFVN